ncbi:MAG TPA: hypothetical protein DCG75_08900 [Bacteroidales bacterium]|nr:hypothetical protein [Bacteroidales bacterium]
MAKGEDLKKIEKKSQEVSKYDFIICPNCGETEVGRFCPSCGQSNKDFNKPIKEIVGDLFDSINLDIRLLKTLLPFFTKPGFLTQEYFNGRRKKYVPPMRMYMFFSILFFFLIQYTGSDKSKNIIKFNETPTKNQASLVSGLHGDTLSMNIKGEYTFNGEDSIQNNSDIILENFSNFDKEKIKQEVLNDSTNSEPLKQMVIGAINASENQKLFVSRFLKNLSYTLFVLMPFFALILAMILWKSRMLYVKHLIFSINFHSFIFGISSIVMILRLIVPEKFSGNEALLMLGIPIYLMVGIKRFYNRKYIGAFFKTFGALMIYSFILSIVVIAMLAFTAKGFYSN